MHWSAWDALRRLRELLGRAGAGGWHGPLRSALRRLVEMDREGSPYAAELAMLLEDLVSEVRPAADAVVTAFAEDPVLASAAGRGRVSRVLVAAVRARSRGRGPEALEDIVSAVERLGAPGGGLAAALAEAARAEPSAARSLVLLALRGRRGALRALAEAVEGAPWSAASLRAAAEALAGETGVPVEDALRLVEEEGVLGLARLLTGLRDAPRSVVAALLASGHRGLREALTPGLAVEAIHRPGWPREPGRRLAAGVEPRSLSGDGWVAAALLEGDILVVEPRGIRRLAAPRGATPPIAAGRWGVAVAVDRGGVWRVALLRPDGSMLEAEAPGEPVALAVAPWGLAALYRGDGGALLEAYRAGSAALTAEASVEVRGEPVTVAARPGAPGAAAAARLGLGGFIYVAGPGGLEEHPLDSAPVALHWSPEAGPVAVTPEYLYLAGRRRRVGLLVEASAATPLAGGRLLLVAPAGEGLPFTLADPLTGEVSELRGGPGGPVEAAAVGGASTVLLALRRGALEAYPLACSEACPPAEAPGHGLEHRGCGAQCRAYRERRGPQGYVAAPL